MQSIFSARKNDQKSYKSLKKKFKQKKNPATLFVQNFFLNIWFSRYLSFPDFTVPKNCSSQQNY